MRRLASPTFRSLSRVALDLVLLLIAWTLAYLIRFDWSIPPRYRDQMVSIAVTVILVQYLALRLSGATRHSWRYTSLRDVTAVGGAALVTAAALSFMRTIGPPSDVPTAVAELFAIPYGVTAINFGTSILIVGGARVLRRVVDESRLARSRRGAGAGLLTVLVGAGDAGVMVMREVKRRPDLGITPVAFIDDNPGKWNRAIHGLRVPGGVEQLEETIRQTGAEQVLITIASPPGKLVRQVAEVCDALGVPVRKIPGFHEIVEGKFNLARIRPVQIEDLLRRDPVTEGSDLVLQLVQDATVMVTGAGGSIGAELCRQLLHARPRTLVLLERSENALYQIHRELQLSDVSGQVQLVPLVTDVTDVETLRHDFMAFRPDIVFHAAAHKHVPMMEALPVEAARNNVMGSKAVIDACVAADVRRVVLISTDKAVNPTSIMGATKRVAERYMQHIAAQTDQKLVAVRFGNVLGSNGSVVPLFQQQIEAGGPVTVTHPDMRRYFMTIPEAVRLVMEAGAMADGGEVFVLDMGEPVRIVDLARDLIRLSGLRPETDIAIEFVGMRPGEKLFEELGLASEEIQPTRHPRIRRWDTVVADHSDLDEGIRQLHEFIAAYDVEGVRSTLRRLVPEYNPTAPADADVSPRPGHGNGSFAEPVHQSW